MNPAGENFSEEVSKEFTGVDWMRKSLREQ